MNPEILLKHFDRIGDAPGSVPRLRAFVLDLAVRGKLVPHDPLDESALELHASLRAALSAKKQAAPDRSRKPILGSPTAFLDKASLPASWELTNFDSVTMVVSGVAKGKDLRGVKVLSLPYLRVANVQRGYLDLAVIKQIEVAANEAERYALKKGDVLMTEGGDWDKLGRAAIWNEEVPNCIHQNHIYRIRSAISNKLIPTWIMVFANSRLGRSYFESASKQTTNLASINMTQLRSCPLPLPPTAEQHRIVAKVEELMDLCDRLEEAQKERERRRDRLTAASVHHLCASCEGTEAIRHARFFIKILPKLTARPDQLIGFKEAVRRLAVRGRLVRQDPRDESVCELMQTGNHQCTEKPFPIPHSWAWVHVRQMGESRLGKMLDKAKNKGKPRRYLRNLNVRWFNFDLNDVLEMRFEDDELEEYNLKRGDVLICEGGEPGRAAVWDESEGQLYFQKAIHRLRLKEVVVPEFFVHCLRESAVSGQLARYFTGVGIKHLTGRGLNSFAFALPPLREQVRIVARLNELILLIDSLGHNVVEAQDHTGALLESILSRAISPQAALSDAFDDGLMWGHLDG